MATIQGTTPTITFNLPFDVSTIQNLEVYFAQNDELLVTKGYNDCVLSGTTLSVTLKQSETLQFDDEEKLQMQVRFRFTDGSVDATKIIKGKIEDLLADTVLSAERSPADTEVE
jgi:hypothetical protein